MSGAEGWKVARLDDIERRGRDIPVREHFGIRAFGINAFTPAEDGMLIGEHVEAGSGQEELYLVLDGNATFEIDGDTVDAPAGTFVLVRPESRRKATGDGTVLVIGATPDEAYQPFDWGEAWSSTASRCVRTESSATPMPSQLSARAWSATQTIPGSTTTTRASRRSRATPATRRSVTSDDPSSWCRASASRPAGTTTLPPSSTTHGSKRLFASS